MKYWKGITGTGKEGHYGTKADNGIVPDSVEITQTEYDTWVATQTPIPIVDYKALYTAATTDAQRIAVIAQRLKLV